MWRTQRPAADCPEPHEVIEIRATLFRVLHSGVVARNGVGLEADTRFEQITTIVAASAVKKIGGSVDLKSEVAAIGRDVIVP